jgi:putative lipoic acid-binding regulatory protein
MKPQSRWLSGAEASVSIYATGERIAMTQKKPEISYPCHWEYKIIGYDSNDMRRAVHSIIPRQTLTIRESRTSSSGKYVSLNVETMVSSEEERTGFCERLQTHEAIRLVL